MPTLIEYVKGVWTSLLPATVKSKMENIEDGLKDACDVLDLETDAGRSMAQAADAAAQRALLNVEDGADVTDEANVTAIVNATAEVTATPAHWWVLVGGALKRMTQAGWTALVLVATGKTNGATGYTLAGGTTPKTLTVSADADTATIPNATGKSAAENIGGKAGASEAIKLGVAAAEAMETGTATATPNDTDVLPGVKADHSLLKYTWANIKAAIWAALGGLIAGGTDKATPLDADTVPLSSAADSAATRKLTWANLKATLKAYNDTLYPALAHATRHQHGGADEIATATPAANVIPKAGAGGTLAAGFLPQATESAVGGAELATAAEIVTGTDTGADRTLTPGRLKTALASDGMWLTKRTKMPDGATAVEYQDEWATLAGWTNTSCSFDVSTSGIIKLTAIGSGARISKSISNVVGKMFIMIAKTEQLGTDYTLRVFNLTDNIEFIPKQIEIHDYKLIYGVVQGAGSGAKTIAVYTGATTGVVSIDLISIGDNVYLPGSAPQYGLEVLQQLDIALGNSQMPATRLYSDGSNISASGSIKIGGSAYNPKATAIELVAEGDFLVGDTAPETLDNIKLALEADGDTFGLTHYCTIANQFVITGDNSDDSQEIVSRFSGDAGRLIATSSTVAHLSFPKTTLYGGYSALEKTISLLSQNYSKNVGYWAGKILSTLGDSITYGGDWQPSVVSALGLQKYLNYGVSSTLISGTGETAMCNDARINAISLLSDIVFVMGGANDLSNDVPLGTIASSNVEEFYGALNAMCVKLITRFPTKTIIIATPTYRLDGASDTNGIGLSIRDYAEAVRAVSKRWCLPCVDLNVNAGWSFANVASFTTDGVHPNEEGYARISALVSNFVLSLRS